MSATIERTDDRYALLAFVERYWSELTLRDARSLCVEIVDSMTGPASIKVTLTNR